MGDARFEKGAVACRDPRGTECDILAVTEGDAGILPAGGHVIDAGTDWGYPLPKSRPGRRKVLLWSRRPWTPVFDRLQEALPGGRLVAGVTETPVGEVTAVGVCTRGVARR